MLQKSCCLILALGLAAQLPAAPRAGVAFTPGYLTAQGTIGYGVAAEWELPLGERIALRYVFGELHYRDTGAVYLSELRMALGFGFSL